MLVLTGVFSASLCPNWGPLASGTNPNATIYIVTGAAGSAEMHEGFDNPQCGNLDIGVDCVSPIFLSLSLSLSSYI